MGLGRLIIEDSLSHSNTPHSVELIWTSYQPDAEISNNTQHSQGTDIHVAGGIRSHNPIKRVASDPSLRPRGHWDRQSNNINTHKIIWHNWHSIIIFLTMSSSRNGIRRKYGSNWGCYYFLFEKTTVKRFVQCHVFAQSPPGRYSNDISPVNTSHRSRFV